MKIFNRINLNYQKIKLEVERIKNALLAIRSELSKNDSTVKGEIFENYVRKYLFPISRYIVIHRTHSFNDKDFIKSSLFPDFIFKCKETGRQFAIEAKFRSKSSIDYPFEICSQEQVQRYKNFAASNKLDVFIVIGVEGTAFCPKNLYSIPVMTAEKNCINRNNLSKYRLTCKEIVNLNLLDHIIGNNTKAFVHN